jgi:polyketide cyclase/dehydrase/lipid transport protein
MLKVIGVIASILILTILIFAATQPSTFVVQRSMTVQAPSEKIYPLIDNFHHWNEWSPWAKLDPGIQENYSGPERGKGAAYAWKGNSKVGEGRMEISDTIEPKLVAIELEFLKPMESRSLAEFRLEPQGDSSTRITWTMSGPNNYLAKLMGVFVNMDTMVGKDFEKGLSNLKTVAER